MKIFEQYAKLHRMTAEQEKPISPYATEVTELIVNVENDQYGHTNYKSFPELFEPGQNAYMDPRGIGFDVIEKDYGLRSFVGGFNIKIRGEVFKGDTVSVSTTIKDPLGNSSMVFIQSIHKEDKIVAQYEMVVVLVDENGPIRIPDGIRESLLI